MPGWAGSFYWMRYMDPHNEKEFAGKEVLAYWESVDLYIGGNERKRTKTPDNFCHGRING
jgi:leucyl-tRNA synthetase